MDRGTQPRMTEHLLYARIASAFGTIGLVWEEADVGPKVSRVLLPHEANSAGKILLIAGIERFLEGEAVNFDLERIALDRCSEFQHPLSSRPPFAWGVGGISRWPRHEAGFAPIGRSGVLAGREDPHGPDLLLIGLSRSLAHPLAGNTLDIRSLPLTAGLTRYLGHSPRSAEATFCAALVRSSR